jgi:hypothetical protein
MDLIFVPLIAVLYATSHWLITAVARLQGGD